MSRRDPCLNLDGSPKIRYRSSLDADREARRMEAKYGEHYDSYRCPNGAHLHVGRSSQRSRVLRERRRIYASALHDELGTRALAQLLEGDTLARIGRRFAAVERRRH